MTGFVKMDHILQFETCISSVELKVSTCTSTVPRFHCHDRLWEYDSLKIGNQEDLTRIKLGGLALACELYLADLAEQEYREY